jgi:hypothetical protein
VVLKSKLASKTPLVEDGIYPYGLIRFNYPGKSTGHGKAKYAQMGCCLVKILFKFNPLILPKYDGLCVMED